MTTIKRWLAAGLLALAGTAQAGQYTDLWWKPQESGWGMNVVQQLETAFVTLFVYGADGKPAWYVASDARVFAYTAGGLPLFEGTLYRTEGPWHAGAFDPSKVKVVPVGRILLEVLPSGRMRVEYSADGPVVVKEVERMTFQLPMAAGNFLAQLNMRQAVSGQPPYGTLQYQAEVLVHFAEDGQAFVRADDSLGRRCEYRGPYAQSGNVARITGAFTCSSGDLGAGTFEITDFEVTSHGISGYLRMFSAGTNAYGRFAALRL